MAGNEYHIISGLEPYTDDEPHRSFGQDRHDGSETESATLSGYTLYTPSSSGRRSPETTAVDDDSVSEQDSLISEKPPQYEETAHIPLPSSAKGSQDHGFQIESESQPCGVPARGCWFQRLRARRCERKQKKRSRVRRFFIFSKITIVLGLLSYFLMTVFFRSTTNCTFSREGCLLSEEDEAVCSLYAVVPNDTAMLTGMQPLREYDSSRREIVVDRGSQAIWGRYPLYDLLSLRTTSGSIAIAIDPQPADPDHPDKPARVDIETRSGSVSVSFLLPHIDSMLEPDMEMDLGAIYPDKDGEYSGIPQASSESRSSCTDRDSDEHGIDCVSTAVQFRPYELDIRTESGSVQGRYIFSTSARIMTQAGSISAVFIPVVSADLPSQPVLDTRTQAGSQSIVLTNPYVVSSDSTAMFQSSSGGYATLSHASSSGSIAVGYPYSWAGDVDATSSSGSICLDGPGLQVTKDGKGHAVGVKYPTDDSKSPEWWGSRGDMNVTLESLGSGSINFHVRGH
jgi:hypothetical protein